MKMTKHYNKAFQPQESIIYGRPIQIVGPLQLCTLFGSLKCYYIEVFCDHVNPFNVGVFDLYLNNIISWI